MVKRKPEYQNFNPRYEYPMFPWEMVESFKRACEEGRQKDILQKEIIQCKISIIARWRYCGRFSTIYL